MFLSVYLVRVWIKRACPSRVQITIMSFRYQGRDLKHVVVCGTIVSGAVCRRPLPFLGVRPDVFYEVV